LRLKILLYPQLILRPRTKNSAQAESLRAVFVGFWDNYPDTPIFTSKNHVKAAMNTGACRSKCSCF
jgi:hypothetical protein